MHFLENENLWIPIKISLTFVRQGPINNIPALIQIMAWYQPDDKPLSGPMMVRLPMHICVTRPQWVNNGSCLCHDGWQPVVVETRTMFYMPQMTCRETQIILSQRPPLWLEAGGLNLISQPIRSSWPLAQTKLVPWSHLSCLIGPLKATNLWNELRKLSVESEWTTSIWTEQLDWPNR